MAGNKTHYRKVFKSDHLGVADLEDLLESGSNLVFTIKNVRQEIGAKVAGKKINANIAYFNEPIKPLVLNATNSKIVKGFAKNSPFVEDWAGIAVQVYIDPTVKMKGDIVGGVRINPQQPQARQTVTKDNAKLWKGAVNAYKRDGNLDAVLAKADISPENMALIAQEAGQNG